MSYKNPHPVLDDDTSQFTSNATNGPEIVRYDRNRNVYFAFMDVLGFKQTFDENRENPDQKFAEKYETTFRYYSHLINKSKFINQDSKNICGAGQTSDSLYFYTTRLDYLIKFIHLYLHFSLFAMSEKVFFRGGPGHAARGRPFCAGCVYVPDRKREHMIQDTRIHGKPRRLCIVGDMEGLGLGQNCQKACFPVLKNKGFTMLARENNPKFAKIMQHFSDPLIIYLQISTMNQTNINNVLFGLENLQ